jgi:hypothetical protein
MTDEKELIKIDVRKAQAMLALLVQITDGPQEAFALLMAVLYEFNFSLISNPITLEELATDVAHSIRTMKEGQLQ